MKLIISKYKDNYFEAIEIIHEKLVLLLLLILCTKTITNPLIQAEGQSKKIVTNKTGFTKHFSVFILWVPYYYLPFMQPVTNSFYGRLVS